MPTADIKFTVIITTLLILLLVAVIVITIIMSNKRHVLQEVKYERELRTMEQEVQEQVLVNVARELHDNIGQLLTVMHMQMEQQKIIHPEHAVLLQPVNETLHAVIGEVRRVGRSLNSDLLDRNGLINTIQHEVQRLQQIGKFSVHWHCSAEPELSKDQKIVVFRIFQEIINNAMKHSGAANIYINLQGGDRFHLEVRDDGKGFDAMQMMRSSTGSGLSNMIRRAELAKLRCNIAAESGKGATYTLEQNI